ncbi:MAG TPA: hypothetical protein VI548_11305 [Chitinophagaceae bacterium]|nr:hypothetical protein [Chitinophagaceae bacterium]
MKQKLTFLIPAVLMLLVSCKNSDDKKNDARNTTAAISFKLIMIQHPVADFEAWKSVYKAHDSIRLANGILHFAIGRGTDDPTMVIVFDKINDMAKAREFTNLPELKEAMGKAGVTGSPTYSYLDVIRNDTTIIEQRDMIIVAHRVKNVDAWLKVFDKEGTNSRREYGLIDRGVAIDINEPNMVYILFAIKDKEKATARLNSEDLKKIMTDAGVEGTPQFMYFSMAE